MGYASSKATIVPAYYKPRNCGKSSRRRACLGEFSARRESLNRGRFPLIGEHFPASARQKCALRAGDDERKNQDFFPSCSSVRRSLGEGRLGLLLVDYLLLSRNRRDSDLRIENSSATHANPRSVSFARAGAPAFTSHARSEEYLSSILSKSSLLAVIL